MQLRSEEDKGESKELFQVVGWDSLPVVVETALVVTTASWNSPTAPPIERVREGQHGQLYSEAAVSLRHCALG